MLYSTQTHTKWHLITIFNKVVWFVFFFEIHFQFQMVRLATVLLQSIFHHKASSADIITGIREHLLQADKCQKTLVSVSVSFTTQGTLLALV